MAGWVGKWSHAHDLAERSADDGKSSLELGTVSLWTLWVEANEVSWGGCRGGKPVGASISVDFIALCPRVLARCSCGPVNLELFWQGGRRIPLFDGAGAEKTSKKKVVFVVAWYCLTGKGGHPQGTKMTNLTLEISFF